jgi:hypothetical protein
MFLLPTQGTGFAPQPLNGYSGRNFRVLGLLAVQASVRKRSQRSTRNATRNGVMSTQMERRSHQHVNVPSEIKTEATMPVILWLLGVPLSLILVLWLVGVF